MEGCHGVTWGSAQPQRSPGRFMGFTRFTRFSLFCIHAGEGTIWTGSLIYKQIRRNRVNHVKRVMSRFEAERQNQPRVRI